MEARHTEEHARTEVAASAIVRRAADRVLDIYNRHPDARLVFHNYPLTTKIVTRTGEIARGEAASEEALETAQLAAWFLHAGYALDYNDPVRSSLTEAERFLQQEHYPKESTGRVLECLRQVADRQTPSSPAARILSDANHLEAFLMDFEERSPLLRLEWEFLKDRHLSPAEWSKLQLQLLLQVKLQTHYARRNFEPLLAALIGDQKENVEKLADRETPAKAPRRFRQLEKKRNPTRAMQTFFRANYRNHINLSSIADNKANIMISVNSILISVLISILSYRNLSETQPVVLLPAVIFLVTGLASLIFAVLSARPKVTNLNRDKDNKKKRDEIHKNIVFFGNFVDLDLDEYEQAMDTVFRNDELLYGNMTRDLYYLGKVLDKKYRYLSVSYNIFMVGFIATVGSFLFLLLA